MRPVGPRWMWVERVIIEGGVDNRLDVIWTAESRRARWALVWQSRYDTMVMPS